MKQRSINNFLLALTAFIWGSAFVAQSVGMNYLGPFTFNSIRSIMGGFVCDSVCCGASGSASGESQGKVDLHFGVRVFL